MKLTDPESILAGEKELIDTINAELDWDAIERLIHEKHQLTIHEDVVYKNGNLIVRENEVAYKFDFEVKVPLSVIFNHEGECLGLETGSMDENEDGPAPEQPQEGPAEPPEPRPMEKRNAALASKIADMISEINQGGE